MITEWVFIFSEQNCHSLSTPVLQLHYRLFLRLHENLGSSVAWVTHFTFWTLMLPSGDTYSHQYCCSSCQTAGWQADSSASQAWLSVPRLSVPVGGFIPDSQLCRFCKSLLVEFWGLMLYTCDQKNVEFGRWRAIARLQVSVLILACIQALSLAFCYRNLRCLEVGFLITRPHFHSWGICS